MTRVLKILLVLNAVILGSVIAGTIIVTGVSTPASAFDMRNERI